MSAAVVVAGEAAWGQQQARRTTIPDTSQSSKQNSGWSLKLTCCNFTSNRNLGSICGWQAPSEAHNRELANTAYGGDSST